MLPLPVRPLVSLGEILAYSLIAFLIALLFTRQFVAFLHRYKLGKKLRTEAVDGGSASVFLSYHQAKAGTPTMGGMLIWFSIVATVVLSRVLSHFGVIDHSLLQRGQVYLPLFTLLGFGILGGIDDYLNIIGASAQDGKPSIPHLKKILSGGLMLLVAGAYLILNRSDLTSLRLELLVGNVPGRVVLLCAVMFLLTLFDVGGKRLDAALTTFLIGHGKKAGLNAWPKLLMLLLTSAVAAYWFYFRLGYNSVHIPFGEMLGIGMNGTVTLGLWYIPFLILVLIGTANAVNVTDGLDGLAAGLLIIAFSAFGIIAYVSELYVLAAFCGVVVGAVAAFLWHNIPPALFFMGDTGALALGGTLAVMAFMINQALVLPLIGFVFVIEMLSVIIQLTSKRLLKRKVFKSAPLHHHLEALNWGESKVTMRLWIIGAFFAFLGVLVAIYG